MPYKSADIGTSPVTFVEVPEHKKLKPIGIKIYNADTADRVITGTDVFTPDASVGVTSPSAQTKQWTKVSAGSGLTADIPRTELEEAELLGTVKFAADSVTANSPIVSLYYELV